MSSGPGADENTDSVMISSPPKDRTAVALFTTDGVLKEANPCAFDVAGLSPRDALGQHYERLSPFSHRQDVVERVGDDTNGCGGSCRSPGTATGAGRWAYCHDGLHGDAAAGRTRSHHAPDRNRHRSHYPRQRGNCASPRKPRPQHADSVSNSWRTAGPRRNYSTRSVARSSKSAVTSRVDWLRRERQRAISAPRRVRGTGHALSRRPAHQLGRRSARPGPTGRAIREGTPQVCHDILEDPAFTPAAAGSRPKGIRIVDRAVCSAERSTHDARISIRASQRLSIRPRSHYCRS